MCKKIRLKPVYQDIGDYYISDEGDVYKKLKSWRGSSGYLDFKFGKDGPHKMIHRLVAESFIPNSENKPEINHIDRNIYNNNASNLEWVTRKENLEHMYNAPGNTPVRNFISCELYKDDLLIDEFKSIIDAARYANKKWGSSISSLQRNLKDSTNGIIIKKNQ